MKLPSHKECLALLEKYGMPQNIIEHSLLVNKIAVYLANRLNKIGLNVDIDVVDRASILHDIAKPLVIKDSKGMIDGPKDMHHIEGEKIIIKEGYPEIGHIVRMHSLKEMENLKNWEEKLVKYADMRVKHDKVVSVRERLDDLNKRYNIPDNERVDEKKVFALEKEIFDKIHESPELIKKVIK